MIRTLRDFIDVCRNDLTDISDAYDVFEFECTTELQETIYQLADDDSPEPFRSAMTRLGFTDY